MLCNWCFVLVLQKCTKVNEKQMKREQWNYDVCEKVVWLCVWMGERKRVVYVQENEWKSVTKEKNCVCELSDLRGNLGNKTKKSHLVVCTCITRRSTNSLKIAHSDWSSWSCECPASDPGKPKWGKGQNVSLINMVKGGWKDDEQKTYLTDVHLRLDTRLHVGDVCQNFK